MIFHPFLANIFSNSKTHPSIYFGASKSLPCHLSNAFVLGSYSPQKGIEQPLYINNDSINNKENTHDMRRSRL